MASPTKINFKIYQGATFKETLRWESATKVYAPIVNITKTAPMVATATNHGIPQGWRVKIVGAQGMKEANTSDYVIASEITTNTVTFNHINALNFGTYSGGGVLEYNQPVDLQGMQGRMQLRQKLEDTTVLKELTTENGGIVINNTLKTIELNISAVDTAAFTFQTCVYSLELVSGSIVMPFAAGTLTLVKEVTR